MRLNKLPEVLRQTEICITAATGKRGFRDDDTFQLRGLSKQSMHIIYIDFSFCYSVATKDARDLSAKAATQQQAKQTTIFKRSLKSR